MRTQCEAETEADSCLEGQTVTRASVETSNRLPVLASQIRQASEKAKAASVESAEHYLAAGHLLIEAKAECKHGEWGPFLERADIHERQARRLMQLARSGLKPDTVSEMGGVKAALEYVGKRRLPTNGKPLFVSWPGENMGAVIWEDDDNPGYYHSVGYDLRLDPGHIVSTRKPVCGNPVQLEDGSFISPVWEQVAALIDGRCGDEILTPIPMPRPIPTVHPEDAEITERMRESLGHFLAALRNVGARLPQQSHGTEVAV